MRNSLNFAWIKYLAKNMDAKTSFASVLVIAIAMIGIFGGTGGLLLGAFLVTPLTVIVVAITQDPPKAKTDMAVLPSPQRRNRKQISVPTIDRL